MKKYKVLEAFEDHQVGDIVELTEEEAAALDSKVELFVA